MQLVFVAAVVAVVAVVSSNSGRKSRRTDVSIKGGKCSKTQEDKKINKNTNEKEERCFSKLPMDDPLCSFHYFFVEIKTERNQPNNRTPPKREEKFAGSDRASGL